MNHLAEVLEVTSLDDDREEFILKVNGHRIEFILSRTKHLKTFERLMDAMRDRMMVSVDKLFEEVEQ